MTGQTPVQKDESPKQKSGRFENTSRVSGKSKERILEDYFRDEKTESRNVESQKNKLSIGSNNAYNLTLSDAQAMGGGSFNLKQVEIEANKPIVI